MTKKARLDVIVSTYTSFFDWIEKWAELGEEQLTPAAAEVIDQRVRPFAAAMARAADDLREAAGVEPRRAGRARLSLPVEEIKEEYKAGLLKRAGRGKGRVVESLAEKYAVSKRTIYRSLATPS